MDPLAHTLLGATLAESGLKRRSRYATATLLIGANLPDIDAVANLWGADAALHSRRGLTHGVLAMVALPLLLAAVVWLWHRWRGSTAATVDAPPFRPRAIAGWLLLAALATWLVVTTELVGSGVKVGWVLGIAVIAALRWRVTGIAAGEGLSRAALASLALYIGLAFGFARLAESAIAGQFTAAREVQANPAPGVPWSHRMVVVEPGAYRVVTREGAVFTLPRREPDAIVKAALAQESVRGFATWTRYPHWTVEERSDRWIVRFQDLRYQGPDIPDSRGIGFAQAEVPKVGVRAP